jgi:hypothetical protein
MACCFAPSLTLVGFALSCRLPDATGIAEPGGVSVGWLESIASQTHTSLFPTVIQGDATASNPESGNSGE